MRLVLDERATYVEGFIMTDLGLTHHAWVTLDGAHAIDVTLPDVVGCEYFGIPFTNRAVGAWLVRQNLQAEPLLCDIDQSLVKRLLSDDPTAEALIAHFDPGDVQPTI